MTVASPRSSAAHLVVAGLSGLAVTVLEFGAVRFMAPTFGQSNYIWSNVIGVILLALALGYWVGGRIADRSADGRPLYVAYLLAAGFAVAVALAGRSVCDALIPEGLGNDRLLPLAFTGSLVATVALFAPPMLVLGMTSPFLVRLDDAPGRAGRTAGRIFAVGTLGSLVGCYLAPLYLLQTVGSRATILLCAAVLAALGVAGLAFDRVRGRPVVRGLGIAFGVACLGLAAHAATDDPVLRRDPGQVVEVESAYQALRVIEAQGERFEEGEWPLYGWSQGQATTRFLRHDEDLDSYQSVVYWPPGRENGAFTGGRYYDHLALGARLSTVGRRGRIRVLILGYAGGSLERALRGAVPHGVELEVWGVEIDPEVVRLARQELALDEATSPSTRLITGEDGRTVLNTLPADRRFDLVFLDAYARTTYVPFQLATRECFEQVAAHLEDGGWIGINLHVPAGLDGALYRSMARTLDATPGLGPVYAVPNPFYPGSITLWAGRNVRTAPRLQGGDPVPAALRTPAFALERMLVRYRPERDGGHVWTDDLSDADRLADEGLLGP